MTPQAVLGRARAGAASAIDASANQPSASAPIQAALSRLGWITRGFIRPLPYMPLAHCERQTHDEAAGAVPFDSGAQSAARRAPVSRTVSTSAARSDSVVA